MRLGLSRDEKIPWIWKLENKLEWKRVVKATAQNGSGSRMEGEALQNCGVGLGLGGRDVKRKRRQK